MAGLLRYDIDLFARSISEPMRRVRRIALGGLALIAVIVIAGGVALEDATGWVRHTREVLRLARVVQLQVLDGAALSPDSPSNRTIEAQFDSLLLLTQDSPDQSARVRAARQAVQEWQRAVQLESASPSSPARLAARRDMRSSFDTLLSVEQSLYSARTATERRWRYGLIIAVLLAVFCIWFAVARFVTTTTRQESTIDSARAQAVRISQRLTFVLDSSPLALAIVDPSDIVELCNPAWRSLSASGEDAVGATLAVSASTVAAQLLPLVDAVRRDGTVQSAELIEGGAATSSPMMPARVWDASVYPILADGPTDRSVGIALLEVTSQRRLEAQVRHAQRMESIGRLAGGVAHDFNNILTAITGFTELASDSIPEENRARNDLRQVRRAADRAAMLTRQLLAFSRQQVLQPRVLNLNDVLRDMETMLRRLIGSHIVLSTTKDDMLWSVMADPGQIEQVIVNLAINARDAMPDGGRLRMETSNITLREGTASHPALASMDGEFVRLRVTDSGTGISPDIQQRIFEPFFTTKAEGMGTGLGLATVYGIVQQSGGTIDVQSEVDVGTSFSLYFPRANGTVEPAAPARIANADSARTGTILMVDDDADVRQLADLVLSRQGFTVITARNGLDALERLDQDQTPVSLLVTDLVMPGLGGRELAARVAARSPETAVLFISGYAADSHNQLTVLPPNAQFLEKPFSPTSLIDAVSRVLSASRTIS